MASKKTTNETGPRANQEQGPQRTRVWITVGSDRLACVHGWEHHDNCQLLAFNADHLAIKVPAHRYFVGNYMKRGYAPPEVVVFKIIEGGGRKVHGRVRVRAEPVIGWETGRKKRGDAALAAGVARG